MANKETFKVFFKVWSAYTKYILRQCVQKRIFSSPFIGSFLQTKSDNKKFQYIPNKEFLETGNFKYDPCPEGKGTEHPNYGNLTSLKV